MKAILALFLLAMYLPAIAYIPLQSFALWRLKGGPRKLALLAVPPMLLVVYLTVYAYMQQSNLWPILLILSAPVADVFLLALLIAFRRTHYRAASDKAA
jgi:hypothetical protein